VVDRRVGLLGPPGVNDEEGVVWDGNPLNLLTARESDRRPVKRRCDVEAREFEWKNISDLSAALNRLAVSIVSCKARRAATATLTESAADVPMPPDVMLNSKGRTRVRSGGKRSNLVR
jgi:hypothetical protein